MKIFIDFDSGGIDWKLTNCTSKPLPFTSSFWEARFQPAREVGAPSWHVCSPRGCVSLAQVALKKTLKKYSICYFFYPNGLKKSRKLHSVSAWLSRAGSCCRRCHCTTKHPYSGGDTEDDKFGQHVFFQVTRLVLQVSLLTGALTPRDNGWFGCPEAGVTFCTSCSSVGPFGCAN